MLTHYAVGSIAMVILLAAWLAVQQAWRRTFPDGSSDPDVLAERMGCGGCGSRERCATHEDTARRAGEEAR
jgi:hypothetical protein